MLPAPLPRFSLTILALLSSLQVLDSIHYRSQLTMGTDGMSKRKDIHTILSLGLKTEGATEQVRGNAQERACAGVEQRNCDDAVGPLVLLPG